jgi:hypothetical protein
MYILSKHFETPPEQEIICPWTGESYVHMEGNDLSLIDPKYHEGALETLPRRFYQQPVVFNKGGGQVQIMVRKPYDY